MATNLPNRAQLTYDGSAVVLSNQTNTTLVDTNTMEITKKAVDMSVAAGADAVYVVRLENTGANNLTNISITDDLGMGALTYLENTAQFYINGSSVTGTAAASMGNVVFTTTETLEPGDNFIVVYSASVGANQTEPITNTVTANATAASTVPAPITATADETINITAVPNVSVFKSADKDTVTSGDTLTYTFTLMNTGNADAENVKFTDVLPTEFTVQTVSYNTGGQDIPITSADYTIQGNTLTIPSETGSLTLTVPAATSDGPGILTITVTGMIA